MCAHLCHKQMHCGICDWCIMVFVQQYNWELWFIKILTWQMLTLGVQFSRYMHPELGFHYLQMSQHHPVLGQQKSHNTAIDTVLLQIYYLPKFAFWQSSSFDRLYVCLSRWKITHDSKMHWHIITKFDPQMHLVSVQNPIGLQGQRSNNQVTRSQNRSRWIREMDTDAAYSSKCKFWQVCTSSSAFSFACLWFQMMLDWSKSKVCNQQQHFMIYFRISRVKLM